MRSLILGRIPRTILKQFQKKSSKAFLQIRGKNLGGFFEGTLVAVDKLYYELLCELPEKCFEELAEISRRKFCLIAYSVLHFCSEFYTKDAAEN